MRIALGSDHAGYRYKELFKAALSQAGHDVTDHELEGYNKFIPYYLHPECIYSVGLSMSSFRTKVSVGSNPWAKAQRMVNLAKVCERYGGGGGRDPAHQPTGR